MSIIIIIMEVYGVSYLWLNLAFNGTRTILDTRAVRSISDTLDVTRHQDHVLLQEYGIFHSQTVIVIET